MLAVALVLVALLLRSGAELARAGVVALGVTLQALPGVPAVVWQAAAFAIVGAAVLPVGPRHWAPALVAAGAASTALAVLGDATPLLAAVYAALTYTVLIVAWGGPRPAVRPADGESGVGWAPRTGRASST